MNILIRKANREDCPRMMELVRELAEFEKASGEVTVSPEHFEESGFGPTPVWWAYVASIKEYNKSKSEYIAGFALYYIRYSTWKGQLMFLEDILVTENLRRRGIGKLLFNKLIDEAIEKKLSGIVWQVLAWNKSAINFYKKYNPHYDAEWLNFGIALF